MTYQDCFAAAANDLLDWDTPAELLPLTITRHAASLVGWEVDRLGSPTWD